MKHKIYKIEYIEEIDENNYEKARKIFQKEILPTLPEGKYVLINEKETVTIWGNK